MKSQPRPRVVLTRAAGEGAAEAQLEAASLSLWCLPAISIEVPEDPSALERGLRDRLDTDLLVFSSSAGVRAWAEAGKRLGLDPFGESQIAVVGARSAAAVEAAGGPDAWVSPSGSSMGLLELYSEDGWKNKRIIFPRAAGGLDEFPDQVRRRGAELRLIEAYRTRKNSSAGLTIARALELSLQGRAAPIAALCFASPSAVEAVEAGLLEAHHQLSEFACAAIGLTTASALRERGVERLEIADRPSQSALIDAAIRFAKRAL